MKKLHIIIKKEFIDIVRDKRTLITMIVIPLLLFPIMFNIMGTISSKQVEKEKEKHLSVGIIGGKNAVDLVKLIEDRKDIKVTFYNTIEETDTLIKQGNLDGALNFENNFDAKINGVVNTGNVTLFYKSANWGVKDRLMQVLDLYKKNVTDNRLSKLKIDKQAINPVEITIHDITSIRESIGKTAGGFLPYIFILFTFFGCTFPAIDLFTNEKERGTLETILTAPVSRLEILFGKMIVVSVVGFTSAMLSIAGLSLGMHKFADNIPPEMMNTLLSIIRPSNVIMLFSLLLPLTVFFAGILTLITTYAKSYKEAQSIISPMTMLVVLPAAIGLIPGIELNVWTALIPITNISLTSKEIISGTMNMPLYCLVLTSLLIYASISVFAATRWFSNENNIIKN